MKIYEFSPFFNENLVAGIKIKENSKWADQTIITEANLTHSYKEKKYSFAGVGQNVIHNKIDAKKIFKKPGWGPSRKFPFFRYKTKKWVNESINRNSCFCLDSINDSDIVIMSDIDEITDPKFIPLIVEEVKKRGVVTFKMVYTLMYFNLVSSNNGAPDWSYRVFFMTGEYFNSMSRTPDQLRKLGERGQLMSEIYCIPDFCGFHHSWLGDLEAAIQKFRAYSHEPDDFGGGLVARGDIDREFIQRCIFDGRSFLDDGSELNLYEGPFLSSVVELRKQRGDLFFSV